MCVWGGEGAGAAVGLNEGHCASGLARNNTLLHHLTYGNSISVVNSITLAEQLAMFCARGITSCIKAVGQKTWDTSPSW